MKENWQKDIHDRLGDYEKDAPDGLWKGIHEKMAPTNGDRRQAEKASFAIRFRRVASVAAAACLALMLGYSIYVNLYDHQPAPGTNIAQTEPEFVGQAGREHSEIPANNGDLLAEASPMKSAPSTDRKRRQETVPAPMGTSDGGQSTETSAAEESDGREKDKENIGTESDKENRVSQTNDRKGQSIGRGNTHADYGTHGGQRGRDVRSANLSRWTVSTSAMGAVGTSESTVSVGEPIVSTGPEYVEWQDDPMLGINIFNQGRTVKTEYKHRHPVRFALTVAYALDRKTSVESGLTYTRLVSEMKNGTDENYFSGEQRLTYIGIPINVKYKAASVNKLSLYGSAGVLVEKCVSGKVSKDYVISKVQKETETVDVDSKPLQLSVGASLGAQLDVADNVGVYVEPGLSYYFDDRSSLQTIYKEKPLNFNLNIGIRYTIGK